VIDHAWAESRPVEAQDGVIEAWTLSVSKGFRTVQVTLTLTAAKGGDFSFDAWLQEAADDLASRS
jgi:hypothetical protein